jgi:ParB-like chromosome segregation protein Spo0J
MEPRVSKPEPQTVSPKALRPNPWNTNFVSPDNEAKLDASLKRFGGLFKPVLVRETDAGLEILGGEHRCEAAIRVGLKEIPIFNLGRLDDTKAKEISLADNARYGADDALGLSELLQSLGTADQLQEYLPYTETDVQALFSSADIALDDLDLPEKFDKGDDLDEPAVLKTPKTHTIMRFKVSLADAERLTQVLTQIGAQQGFTDSDQLTNAGDALTHIVFGSMAADE